MDKQAPAKHILVLDDDPDIVRVLKIMLEDEGYTVSAHTDAAKVLEVLRTEKVDLFILDEDTKGLSIGDFIAQATQLPVEAAAPGSKAAKPVGKGAKPLGLDVPLLVLCASEEKALKALHGFRGAAGFVAKPLSRGELVDRVRMLLDQERSYWRLEKH